MAHEKPQSRKDDGPSSRLVLEVPLNGNLDQLIRMFIKASGGNSTDNTKLDAIIEMLRGIASVPANLALVKEELSIIHGLLGDNSTVLSAINNLSGKVDTMSSNIDRIEKEAADAAENVNLVRTAIEELKGVVSGLKTEVAQLQEQIAQGQLNEARLQAAAETLEKADDEIDAIVLPAAPPPVEPVP